MLPTISQVCSLNSTTEKDIEDYAAGRCQSLEIWLTKLQEYLENNTCEDFLRLLEEHGVKTHVAGIQGGLLTSQGHHRAEAWQLFEERLTLCQQLGVGTIVVTCDVAAPVSRQDIERAQVSLKQLADLSERYGVRCALEPHARAAFGNNLQTAVALIDEVGSEHLGICLDVFHFYLGPSKLADLGLLTRQNLFHVQLSDLADVPRELATDSDRIMPGEGDIPMDPVLDRLRTIDYQGCVSLEIMNPQIWQVPALQFGEIGMTALRKLMGQAEK